ncbi:MAG: hypothetical protein JWP81_1115 [Ferruginibacter sp.]|nr:hypothetical protein [Ferruginibacter sp.]
MNQQAMASKISMGIIFFALVTSSGGLWIPGLYHDNDFVKSAWFASDIITFFVAVPLLCLAVYFSKKGSARWRMLWCGLLGYMFYNFAFIFLVRCSMSFSCCMLHYVRYRRLRLSCC